MHNFSYGDGVAICTTELLSDDTFQQECNITHNNKDFNIKFTVQYDGETIETQAEVQTKEVESYKWSQKPGSMQGYD